MEESAKTKNSADSDSSFRSRLNKSVSFSKVLPSHESVVPNSKRQGRLRAATISDKEDYCFRDNLHSIRSYIKNKFQILKGRISELEDKMLDSLAEIEGKYSQKLLENKEAMNKIQNLKIMIDDVLQDNSLQIGINNLINDKLKPKSSPSEICVTLQWPRGMDTFLNQLDDALKITKHDEDTSPLDSPSPVEVVRVQSLQSFGRLGQGIEDMVSPRAVTISTEGLVYCSDWENNTIMCFSPSGMLKYSFTNVKHPYSLCAHNNRLYVTEANNSFLKVGRVGNHACVKSLDLKGNLLNKVGKYGSSNGHFKSPSGITVYQLVDGEDKVFVCDTDNNRLQIFNSDLQFARLFLAGKVKQPDDVKVQEMKVYVMDKRNPCLHIFTFQEEALASIISQGPGRDLESSYFFTLDKSGCIVLGDHEKHCLKVFTPNGKLARIIGSPNAKTGEFYLPLGIAQSKDDDQMAVVSLRQTGCVQLFNINLSLFSF
ncbi:PEP-CTERM domain protein [Oopsacas minuta]|uniref:PEP-CTERM domain protein n=1 Tax=Oopsacas minuta TaxID=111878 RepID=A0AAV7JB73_9METZ|nr:PEP-CTERM domain protein [Oopsacas minuta]